MVPVVSHKAKGIYLVYDVLAALLSAMMIALSVTDPGAEVSESARRPLELQSSLGRV